MRMCVLRSRCWISLLEYRRADTPTIQNWGPCSKALGKVSHRRWNWRHCLLDYYGDSSTRAQGDQIKCCGTPSTWTTKQQQVILVLKSISTDESTLASILGSDMYKHLISCLDVAWINNALRSGSATPLSASAGAHDTSAPPASVAEDANPAKRKKLGHPDPGVINFLQ
ncbi:hypothetical protein BOTBODRAFT_297811 [Botryobasidium botryosum FD-172 SS1]|uniref:Uncharacterized protein n=1 Tax=Botryobasidium botryosum (strain FD-172 SS1) TaxID=930990 RepID=A0A067MKS4_BOTB1|nr:hypothetical protein BOTBODRAFT_297811 [Botryobasidium botryosum FD-172 SS1]